MSPVNKICFVFFLVISLGAQAQVSLDSLPLRNTKGKQVSLSSVTKQHPLVMVCFWSMNNESSIRELTAISLQYARMKQPVSFCLLAICVDEGNLLNRMRSVALQNEWVFDVYADVDGGLQHALHFSNPPQSMILDKGSVVYQHSGFESGAETYLFSQIQALSPRSK